MKSQKPAFSFQLLFLVQSLLRKKNFVVAAVAVVVFVVAVVVGVGVGGVHGKMKALSEVILMLRPSLPS